MLFKSVNDDPTNLNSQFNFAINPHRIKGYYRMTNHFFPPKRSRARSAVMSALLQHFGNFNKKDHARFSFLAALDGPAEAWEHRMEITGSSDKFCCEEQAFSSDLCSALEFCAREGGFQHYRMVV